MGRGGQNPKDGKQSNDGVQGMRPVSLGKVEYRGKITMDELKKHRTPKDAWLLVKGKVRSTCSFAKKSTLRGTPYA